MTSCESKNPQREVEGSGAMWQSLRASEIAFGCRDMECHIGGGKERACEKLRGIGRQLCGFGEDVRLCTLRRHVECNPRVKGLRDSGKGRPVPV